MSQAYKIGFEILDDVRDYSRYFFLDVPFKFTGFLVSFVDFLFHNDVLAKIDLAFVKIESLVKVRYIFGKLD